MSTQVVNFTFSSNRLTIHPPSSTLHPGASNSKVGAEPRARKTWIFSAHSFSMVGRETNKIPVLSGNKSADSCRLLAPDRPHFASGQLLSKEQV